MTQNTFDQAVNTFERLNAKPTAEDIISLSNYLASLASVQDALGSTPPAQELVPEPKTLKVGDILQTEEDYRNAPVGTVVNYNFGSHSEGYEKHPDEQWYDVSRSGDYETTLGGSTRSDERVIARLPEPTPQTLKAGDRIVVAREGSDMYGQTHAVGRRGVVDYGPFVADGHIGVTWDDRGGDNMPLISSLAHEPVVEPEVVEPQVYVIDMNDYWRDKKKFEELAVPVGWDYYSDILGSLDYEATEESKMDGSEWRVLKSDAVEALGEFKPVKVPTLREQLEALSVGAIFGPDRGGDYWKKVESDVFKWAHSRYALDFIGYWSLDMLSDEGQPGDLLPNGVTVVS